MQQTSADAFERHLLAGGELLRESRVDAACREFEAALSVRPDDPKALGLLGLAHFRRSAFADALPVYQKLVDIQPSDASFRLNLGLVHLKLGDATRAIEQLAASRRLDPGQRQTVSYLGLAYARGGEYALAYEAFLQAGQTDLASEMEQHLSEPERQAIADRVVASRSGESMETPAVTAPAPAAAVPTTAPSAKTAPTPKPAAPPPSPPAVDPEAAIAEADASSRDPFADWDREEPKRSPSHGESDAETAEPSRTSRSGMVSRMVRIAAPSKAAESAGTRTALGHSAPVPLTAYATDRLVRPEDGDHPFEVSGEGLLIVHVDGRTLSRTDGVIASGGELGFEPVRKRVRGAPTESTFGGDDAPVFSVTGSGYLIASPGKSSFAALLLSDDILYLREEYVFAFEERLRWENGHVPGSKGAIGVVQLRGDGAVAMRTPTRIVAVKLGGERVLYVDQDLLVGWIGRVIPKVTMPAGGDTSTPFVECSGEGIVLLVDDRDG